MINAGVERTDISTKYLFFETLYFTGYSFIKKFRFERLESSLYQFKIKLFRSRMFYKGYLLYKIKMDYFELKKKKCFNIN